MRTRRFKSNVIIIIGEDKMLQIQRKKWGSDGNELGDG